MSLDRFLKGHNLDYETALSEIKAGHKQSHWIWYIFNGKKDNRTLEILSFQQENKI